MGVLSGLRSWGENSLRKAANAVAPAAQVAEPVPVAAAQAAPVAAAPAPAGVRAPGAFSTPGMTATERPMTSADSRLFAKDPGPGNPNVGRAAPTGNYTPVEPAKPTALRAAPGLLARGAGVAGIGMGAFNAAQAAQEGDGAGVALGAGDAAAGAALVSGVGTVPAMGYLGVRAAHDLGRALPTSTRDAIGGTVNNVLRSAKFLSNGASMGLGEDDSSIHEAESFLRSYKPAPTIRRGQQPLLAGVTPSTAGAGRGSGFVDIDAPNPTDRRLAVTPDAAGVPVAGAPGVRKLGRGNYTNVDNDYTGMTGPGVSVVGGAPGGNSNNDADLSAARSAAADRGDWDAVAASYGGNFGGQTAGGAKTGLRAQLEGKKLTRAGAEALANLDRNEEAARSGARRDTIALRGQDVTMRGQDMDFAGKQATAAATAARAKQDQANEDRKYAFDVQKHGVQVADQKRTARTAADTALTTELESMHTTKDAKGNIVVDKAAVAAKKQAVTSLIGNKIAELRAVPANHPNYAKAQQLATKLDEDGTGALGKDDLQRLLKQVEMKEIAKKDAGLFGGSYKESDDPSDYDIVGTEASMLGDRYKLRGGGSVRQRKVDYANGGGAILPNSWVDNETSSFDILKRGVRQ